MTRELLFSVTRDDLVLQKFRAGGKGGQAQNKTSSGVRLIHPPSGARGESREERSFEQNRRNAFRRLVATEKFKTWLRLESARRNGQEAEVQAQVKRAMEAENLRVEVKQDGRCGPDTPSRSTPRPHSTPDARLIRKGRPDFHNCWTSVPKTVVGDIWECVCGRQWKVVDEPDGLSLKRLWIKRRPLVVERGGQQPPNPPPPPKGQAEPPKPPPSHG